MSDVIRILIVDDQKIVRKGLRVLIETKPHLEVVGEAVNGDEAILQTQALQPDVILMDLEMPRKDGIDAIQEIKRENSEARILVLTSYGDDARVFAAVKAGALGYLLKDASPQELVAAIEAVNQGEPSLDSSLAMKLVRELNRPSSLPPTPEPLTSREMAVLKLLAQGLSNQEIAAALTISERTVGGHVSNILTKLHLANRTQAALYALREGLTGLFEA